MMRFLPALPALIALSMAVLPIAADARPLHVLIVNDDGLTSNALALYQALKARGDDVIVSLPCHNQSGKGTALNLDPPTPLSSDCRAGAALAGSPAAGAMTRAGLPAGDFHYVEGTPTIALLHGLDMLAPARWHGAPDLVLSGPNEGRNLGPAILASGTVSAVRFALVRGVPAVAISAGTATADDAGLANPASTQIARRAVSLINALDDVAGSGPLLPAGIALNVNLPDRTEQGRWKMARIGSYDAYALSMVPDATSGARLSLGLNPNAPTKAQAGDEAAVAQTDISVSPITGDTPPTRPATAWLKRVLARL